MSKRHKKTHSFFKNIFLVGVICFFITSGAVLLWVSTLKIPDLESFEQRKISQSTKIYDRTGEILLFDVHSDTKRTIVSFDEISRNVKNASVAIEDAEFYEHKGVKPLAFLRAVLVNIKSRKFSQGGSTITQQVIKNSILTSEKKVSRKLKEWALAIKLEQLLSKEQILERYLNESPYGGSIYGIEEASKTFFNKSASDLTLAESAYLAALPQAPTFYSPYGNNKDKLDDRKNLVLSKMLEYDFISEEEFNKALNEEVVFQIQENTGIKAPHFVMYIREYLAEKYGERAIEERGFKVTTTLDYELQKIGEETVAKYVEINKELYNASNAALVAIDPKTGQILTMVGSRNYFDEDIDGNFNVTLAHRQPGSAFKPFVYATALEKGYTPDTIVFDLKTQFSTKCEVDNLIIDDDCYAPNNYDSNFRGPITMREALAQSINIPAIKFLYLSGLKDSLQTAKSMGIKSLTNIDQYGLTLVLGGGEVSLLDITGAYSVFANEGIKNQHTGVLKIEDSKGNIIEEFKTKPIRVLSSQTSLKISSMLSDDSARSPMFGSGSLLHLPGRDVAVKTGTTNDYRDAWVVGYSPNLSVGVWSGNNDNSPMESKPSVTIVSPMWNSFLNQAFAKIENEKFRSPIQEDVSNLKPILRGIWNGGEFYKIDKISGKLATEFTPIELVEEKFTNDPHSILYFVDKNNPTGPIPLNPENDPQFKAWEYSVNEWKKVNNISTSTNPIIPIEYDDIHKPEFYPQVKILNIENGGFYTKNTKININLDIKNNKFPISKVDYFINNKLIESKTNQPFSLSIIFNDINITDINNKLTVIVYDNVLNKGESSVNFTVN